MAPDNDKQTLRRWLAYSGIAMASSFFAWLLIGLLPGVPSMTDVFDIPGLRWPVSFAVLGLLMAAIGFWDF